MEETKQLPSLTTSFATTVDGNSGQYDMLLTFFLAVFYITLVRNLLQGT